jgi:hypothetical protein
MVSYDLECLSRLAFAMLQSCLHGTVTGYILLNPYFGLSSVCYAYAYLFFALGSLRWWSRIAAELKSIQLHIRDSSRVFAGIFCVVQLYMWYLGWRLYLVRRSYSASLLEPDTFYVHSAMSSMALGVLLAKMKH